MSRIHEALKKAEQERVTAQSTATEIASMPAREQVAMSLPVNEGAPGFAGDIASPSPSTMAPAGDYLRFDDLLARCAKPRWQFDPKVNVFFNPELSAHGAEQFRTLRSRLYQLRGSQSLRTILVTSSIPGEGKTFVTANLAQAIVRQPDRRVLVIDADLRCERLHTLFGAPSNPGLTDYLRGEADEMAIIQHGHEGNLCFIPGGNEVTDPSELLLNGRLKKLLDRVTPVFDWVIVDSPPCLPVADSTLLADLCDGVLLVVRAGSTPAEVAQRARRELQKKNVIGVVLNVVEETQNYEAYYYNGYGYGQSGSKDLRT